MSMFNLILIAIVVLSIVWSVFFQNKEKFFVYNIRPTESIDPDYININENPDNYYNFQSVGDVYGVDLNCNNVSMQDLLEWIRQDDPNVLYEFVYKYDPSVDILNPLQAPRVFKMLLRNLPQKHKYIPILTKCLYKPVRIA